MNAAPCPYCDKMLDFTEKVNCPFCDGQIVYALTIYPHKKMSWCKPIVMCLNCGWTPAECHCETPQWNHPELVEEQTR